MSVSHQIQALIENLTEAEREELIDRMQALRFDDALTQMQARAWRIINRPGATPEERDLLVQALRLLEDCDV